MTLLIVYVLLALVVSFLCSVMEAVLLSLTPSFLVRTEAERPRLGRQLRELKEDVDRPLAAILSLNTIAHTVGAAGAGAQAAVVFGEAWLGVASAVLTLLILILSEIIPKTLGALYWRQLAPLVLHLLRGTMISMWPLVRLSQGLTRLLASHKVVHRVSREELVALAELGTREGILEEKFSRVLRNLFHLRRLRVRDIMTPRTVLFSLSETATIAEVMKESSGPRFSRIPLVRRDLDDVTGFALRSDILLKAARGEVDSPLAELRRPLLVVTELAPLSTLLDLLLDERAHIAQVVDEFGGTAGIVTMEDLLETLLGVEIVDEGDRVQDMQEWARQRWRERAVRLGLPVDPS